MAFCAPVNPCPCQNWSIGPGEQLPLTIDWSGWLASVPGFFLHSVETVELIDLNTNPPSAIDPENPDAPIRLVSGMDVDPPISQPGFALIVGQVATQFIVEASPDVPIGRAYRLNFRINARDCSGRKIAPWDCIFISIAVV